MSLQCERLHIDMFYRNHETIRAVIAKNGQNQTQQMQVYEWKTTNAMIDRVRKQRWLGGWPPDLSFLQISMWWTLWWYFHPQLRIKLTSHMRNSRIFDRSINQTILLFFMTNSGAELQLDHITLAQSWVWESPRLGIYNSHTDAYIYLWKGKYQFNMIGSFALEYCKQRWPGGHQT